MSDVLRAVEEVIAWLEDKKLSTWPYMEGEGFHRDRTRMIATLRAALAPNTDDATAYARELAVALVRKHYPENTGWEPLPDLMGLLSQIDNATTGLTRAVAPVTDEEVDRIRERHEAENERWRLRQDAAFFEPGAHQAVPTAHTDRATLLRRDAQREAELERLREALEKLTDCQPVPKVYKYTGTAEVDVESMFDVGHRHKSGKQPRDYLMSWLSMFRPFAYATKDDSWGELEKLISIVMNNYVQILVKAEKARAAQTLKESKDV